MAMMSFCDMLSKISDIARLAGCRYIRPTFPEHLVIIRQNLVWARQTKVRNRALPMRQKRKPGHRRVEQFPTAGGVIARLAYAEAKAAGIVLDPLLKKSGLSRRQMDDSDELVRVHEQ